MTMEAGRPYKRLGQCAAGHLVPIKDSTPAQSSIASTAPPHFMRNTGLSLITTSATPYLGCASSVFSRIQAVRTTVQVLRLEASSGSRSRLSL